MLDPVKYLVNKAVLMPQKCKNNCEEWVENCEATTVKVKGDKIILWYLPAKNPDAYIVSSHGTTDCICNWAITGDWLREWCNASVLVYEYRGYGRSEGKTSVEHVVQDGAAAMKWLCRRENIKPSEIITHGMSLGGAVATHLAAKFNTKGLIVENSFSSVASLAKHYGGCIGDMAEPWLRKYLNSAKAIANYHGAFLQYHVVEDSVVPYESGCELFDACPSKRKFFVTAKGRDHCDCCTNHYIKKRKEFVASLRRR